MDLSPCARCARHVAVDAEVCPFCGAPRAVPLERGPSPPAPAYGMPPMVTLYGIPAIERPVARGVRGWVALGVAVGAAVVAWLWWRGA